MKKVYLTGAVMAFSSLMFAQTNMLQENMKNIEIYNGQTETRPTLTNDNRAEGDVIVADDFSNAANWLTPVDGNGYQWTIGSSTPANIASYMGSMASSTNGNGFASFDGISLLLDAANTVFTAQDAVVELNQTINCTAIPGIVLEFEQRYRAFNADETIVEVSGDGGANWTEYLINEEIVTNADATQNTISLNISAVAGNSANVQVRFRWRELGADQAYGAGYGWMVDDFQLIEAWNYETAMVNPLYRMGVGMTYTQGMEYHMIPTTQISPIEYSCQIINNGGLVQTGSNLGVDIMFGGNSVYSETSPNIDIAVGSIDTFVVANAYTPAAIGTYDVTMVANQANPDHDPTNNVFTTSFEVTDYTFARDDNNETGSISNVSNNTGLSMSIGNVMNIFNNGVIGALEGKITTSAANVGGIMYGAVYFLNAAEDGYDWAGQSNDYEVVSGDLGNFIRLTFEDPIAVSAGQEILIVLGHYGADIEFSYAQGTQNNTVLGYTDDGANLFNLTGPSAIMVRVDMRDFTGVEETTANNINVSQNVPNPFNGNTVISYSLTEASTVSIKVVDVTGNVVSNINEETKTAGEHNITIDGSSLAQGTYFYTFTAGEYTVTKRMIVTK